MAEGMLLSKQAADRIRDMLRWYEHTGKNILPQRRRNIPGEGKKTGTEIHKAYCAEDAPALDVIRCFLDEDIDAVVWIVSTLYTTASYEIGTDGKIYHCKLGHRSTANDRPITGANWATYWELAEINVHCAIWGDSMLDTCVPLLKEGDLLRVFYDEDDEEWVCVMPGWFHGDIPCTPPP